MPNIRVFICTAWTYWAELSLAVTTPLNGYEIEWRVDSDDIEFTLMVDSDGWIGFGISGGAGMKGADIVRISGNGSIEDGYALAKMAPEKDCQQDWTLVSRTESAGQTTAIIRRKLITGDPQDRQLVNDGQSTVLLVAYGKTGQSAFAYHEQRRSTVRVNLFGQRASLESLKADPDIKTLSLEAKDFKIPFPGTGPGGELTTYMNVCVDVPEDAHVVAWEPVITRGHEAVVHHMVIFTSSIPCASGKTDGQGEESLAQTSQSTNVWLYGPGTDAHLFPPDIGFPIGNKVKALINNIHYDNPEKRVDLVDSSGIIVHFTTKKRKYDLGVLFVGDPAIANLGKPVGLAQYPDHPLSKYSFTCPANFFKEAGAEGEIKILGSALHMHFGGEFMKTELLDWSGKPKAVWQVDFYDGAFQALVDIPDKPVIEAGDFLRSTCVYDSKSRHHETRKPRVWGFGAEDEMCMDWVYYYSTDPAVVESVEGTATQARCGFFDGYMGSERKSAIALRRDLGITFGDSPNSGGCSQPSDPKAEYVQLYLNRTGTTMSVATMGNISAATTFLCLHGFPSTSSMWLPEFGPELIRQVGKDTSGGVRIIAPDLRGVNRTVPKYPCVELGCDEYNLTVIVDEVRDLLLDHFADASPVHIVAHDWGGIVAFRLAIFYPNLVRSLTVANMAHPAVFVQFLKHDKKQQAASEYTAVFKESDLAYESLKPNQTNPGIGAELLRLVPEGLDYLMNDAWLYEDSLKHHLYWYRGSGGFSKVADGITSENAVLEMPVLQIWGRADPYVLDRQICCMKNVARRLTVKTLDVDHWVFEQRPIDIAAAIAEFLQNSSGNHCAAVQDVCSGELEDVCKADATLPQDHGCDTSAYPDKLETPGAKCSICIGQDLNSDKLAGERGGKRYSCLDVKTHYESQPTECEAEEIEYFDAICCKGPTSSTSARSTWARSTSASASVKKSSPSFARILHVFFPLGWLFITA